MEDLFKQQFRTLPQWEKGEPKVWMQEQFEKGWVEKKTTPKQPSILKKPTSKPKPILKKTTPKPKPILKKTTPTPTPILNKITPTPTPILKKTTQKHVSFKNNSKTSYTRKSRLIRPKSNIKIIPDPNVSFISIPAPNST